VNAVVAGIEVGQIWESRDRRLAGRRVTIEEITPNYVRVSAGSRARNRSRISIVQLPKTYRLVQGGAR